MILVQNRHQQLIAYWSIYKEINEAIIPVALIRMMEIRLGSLDTTQVSIKKISDHINNIMIDNQPTACLYSDAYLSSFLKCITDSIRKLKLVKLPADPVAIKRVLISAYSVILHGRVDDEFLRDIRLIAFEYKLLNTYHELSKIIGKGKEGSLECLKGRRYPKGISLDIADLPLPKKHSLVLQKDFLKKKILFEGEEFQDIESLLNFYILNNDLNSLIELLMREIGSGRLGKRTLALMIESLFQMGRLSLAREIIKISFKNKGLYLDQKFLSLILKKILILNKKKSAQMKA